MTQDIDLCLLCGFGKEAKYAQVLLDNFHARISDALTFALTNRVLLVSTSNGVASDISFSGLPFEEEMQGENLDMDYVLRQLSPLCDLKGAREITGKLKNMAGKSGG